VKPNAQRLEVRPWCPDGPRSQSQRRKKTITTSAEFERSHVTLVMITKKTIRGIAAAVSEISVQAIRSPTSEDIGVVIAAMKATTM